MGCNKEKTKEIIIAFLIVTIFLSTFMLPISIAADDTIHVTFDPTGSVSLDVSPQTLNFSTVTANGNEESGTTFTLYNNGTIAMQTDCDTNATTDEGDLTLDADGSPTEDTYSLRFTSTTMDGDDAYITDAGVTLDNSLSASGSDTFKITIYLGPISTDHGWQTTTVNFTGTAAS